MTNLDFVVNQKTSQNKRDLIKSEIDNINEKYLDEIYNYVLTKKNTQSKPPGNKESFMSQIKKIKIDAPVDFSTNYEQYMRGEKSIEPDIH